MTKLLIVESPAKCKKIQGFLGAGWRVQATMGHIRALKEGLESLGFDATKRKEQTWNPTYESIKEKRDAIASLRKATSGSSIEVYLGSDDDREGEAIAWHTCQILGLDPATTPRVIFHEITEPALKAAVAHPGRIDMNKFHAQQARTMLDMLIGFTLSPCLWRSVGYKPGLSAGRCQTPALRIIYDRDRAIEAHETTLSWRIQMTTPVAGTDLLWSATANKTEEEVAVILAALASQKPQTLTITDRQERIATSQPPASFITSSLQQEASSRLGLNPKVTMRLAQTLYEAGHITYMRTDNPVMSEEAVAAARAVVTERWGAEYLPADGVIKKKVVKKTKAPTKGKASPEVQAQNAHESIRPTHFEVTEPDDVGPQEQRLYTLVWTRAIQSVMAPETRDVVKLTGNPSGHVTSFETSWDQTRFAGYRVLDAERKAEEEATAAVAFIARKALVQDHVLPWTKAIATEVRTSPPPRYTEASLIRDLEGKGIGRPSTYATLVETVLDRGYVEKATIAAQPVTVRGYELKAGATAAKPTTKTEKAGGEKDKLRTTALGRTVIEWLLTTFGDMLEYEFTAAMEAQLDAVAKGDRAWPTVLQDTWSQYADRYAEVMSGPSVASATTAATANKKDFGDGYKMVVSKKGPLFVLEVEGQKTRFATVPGKLSIQTAMRADAEAAFAATAAAAEGEILGELDGATVIRKKGPYGHYVTWKEHRVTCKVDETLEALTPRLQAKMSGDVVDHTVGPYKIRKGPYGLYMFKTGGTKKPTFVSIPEGTPWATLTLESAEQIYKHCAAAKAPAKRSSNKETAS